MVAEERRDLLGDLGHLVERRERAEPAAHAGRRTEPAPDPDVVAVPELGMHDADEPDVVDLVLRAPVRAARDRDLELARQVREPAIAHEVARDVVHDRGRVEELIRRDARERAADDVAPHVAAGLRTREPDPRERVEYLGQVLDLQPVQLQALARRDVARAAPEAQRQIGDRGELRRSADPVRDADAHHQVAVFLGPLRVHAPPLGEHKVVGRERSEATRNRRAQ